MAFCHKDADMTPKNAGHLVRFASVLVVLGVAASLLLTVRSYSYSDHLTYSDVELSTDEGLFSLIVPMARLAPGHEASNDWRTYTLSKATGMRTERWVAGRGTKFRVREYVVMLGKRGDDETLSSGMVSGFGYVLVDATWTSNSRPGHLLWLIAPIWAVAAVSTAAIGIPIYLRARFGIRSLMFFTLIAAGILLLPTLHAPS
jgi:hypothetical protein